MRLPWVQVDQSAFARAEELAAILSIGMPTALGHLVMLWRWAIELGPDDMPPLGVAEGRVAVVRLEAGSGWRGERGVMFAALVDLGLVDGDAETFRVRGLDRYEAVVSKRATDRARKAALKSRNSDGVPPEVARNSDGKRFESKGKTQTQTQTQRSSDDDLPAGAENDVGQVEAFAKDIPKPAGPTPEDLRKIWNQHRAPEQPEWREISPKRAAAARARLRERPLYGSPDSWEAVVQRIARSSFARGLVPSRDGRTPWVADPDWLLTADGATKALEGKYDDRGTPAPSARVIPVKPPDLTAPFDYDAPGAPLRPLHVRQRMAAEAAAREAADATS